MRHQHHDQPDLTPDDWYVVSDAYRDAWSVPDTSLFSTVAARLKSAVGFGEAPVVEHDPRTLLLHDFVARTRRYGRPATELADALVATGLSDRQVTALALLSIH